MFKFVILNPADFRKLPTHPKWQEYKNIVTGDTAYLAEFPIAAISHALPENFYPESYITSDSTWYATSLSDPGQVLTPFAEELLFKFFELEKLELVDNTDEPADITILSLLIREILECPVKYRSA